MFKVNTESHLPKLTLEKHLLHQLAIAMNWRRLRRKFHKSLCRSFCDIGENPLHILRRTLQTIWTFIHYIAFHCRSKVAWLRNRKKYIVTNLITIVMFCLFFIMIYLHYHDFQSLFFGKLGFANYYLNKGRKIHFNQGKAMVVGSSLAGLLE